MNMAGWMIGLLAIVFLHDLGSQASNSVSLTVAIPNRDRQCFSQIINQTDFFYFTYHVIRGGERDINVMIYYDGEKPESPASHNERKIMYKNFKTKKDKVHMKLQQGIYTFCFGNEFSQVSYKVVSFALFPQEVEKIKRPDDYVDFDVENKTMMEVSAIKIFRYINGMKMYQRVIRLKDAESFDVAFRLNSRVMQWSAGQLFIIIFVGLGQVWCLRRFFCDKKSTYSSSRSCQPQVVYNANQI